MSEGPERERLSGALQENLLTLLCFDDANCKVARGALTPQLFESAVYREVAGAAIDFIDQFGETIKEHLPDHLEHILKGEDARKAASYERVIRNLYEARGHVNGEYVISRLHDFVRQQNFKDAVIRAAEALRDGKVDEAEVAMQSALNRQAVAFDPGLRLDSPEDVAALLDSPEEEGFPLGIPELDVRGLFPRRKTLTTFVAARGMGKSWFLTHSAKMAMVHGWSVSVVTLEMGQKSYGVRFLQSFFSISKREAEVSVSRLRVGRDGDLLDLFREKMERWTLKDDDIKSKLMRRIRETFSRRAPLRIKAFPTGSLTVAQLEAYLDGLERFEKFTPDVLIVDYPDLMEMPSDNLRIHLGKVIEKIRGIAVRRNLAAIIVTQGNRESEKATTVTTDQVAEDISKLATSDLVFTYSQTPAEYALGLARLMVGKARDAEGKFSVLITQAYAIGQFCLDSVLLRGDYWNILRGDDGDGPEEAPRRPRRRSEGNGEGRGRGEAPRGRRGPPNDDNDDAPPRRRKG